jgi:hypothetical protein
MIEVRMGDKPSVWTEIILVSKLFTISSSSFSRRPRRFRNVAARVTRAARAPSWALAKRGFSSSDFQGTIELVRHTGFHHDSDRFF